MLTPRPFPFSPSFLKGNLQGQRGPCWALYWHTATRALRSYSIKTDSGGTIYFSPFPAAGSRGSGCAGCMMCPRSPRCSVAEEEGSKQGHCSLPSPPLHPPPNVLLFGDLLNSEKSKKKDISVRGDFTRHREGSNLQLKTASIHVAKYVMFY